MTRLLTTIWPGWSISQAMTAKRGRSGSGPSRSIRITPCSSMSLAMFLEEAGDRQARRRISLSRAVQLSPAVLDSPFFTRHARSGEDIVKRCIAETEGKLTRANDPVLKARLGKFYLFTNDLQRAAHMLQESAKELPNLPLVWFNLGEVYRFQGDSAQALACYERARFLDGRLPGPHSGSGSLDQSGHAVEELLSCFATVGADESGDSCAQ